MGIISTNQKKATPTTIAVNAVTEVHLLRTSVTYFRHKSNIKLAAIYLHSLWLVHVHHKAATYQLQHKAATSHSTHSDELNHTKYVFMQHVFRYLKTIFPNIEQIIVFSDGPTSQFKQRFLFSNLYAWEMEHDLKSCGISSVPLTGKVWLMESGEQSRERYGGM